MKTIAIYIGMGLIVAACSGGSSNPGALLPTPSEPALTLLQDVFPTTGQALQWSLRPTNATELKTYLEKAVVAQDQKLTLPVAVPAAPATSTATATATATS
jgi:hypothetical protein